jgi:hypothetical protein
MTLYNFPNLGMGGLSRQAIGCARTQVEGCFPSGPYLSHAMNVRWFVGKTFGHVVIDMQGLVWCHFHGRLCRGSVTS